MDNARHIYIHARCNMRLALLNANSFLVSLDCTGLFDNRCRSFKYSDAISMTYHSSQRRMLGFNAVRVAFAFDDNWGINSPVVDWTGDCKVPTESQIRKSLVPGKNASTTIKSNSNTLPPLAPPDVPDGICNSDWPKDSTYQRFIWVIDYLISQV